MKTTAIVKNGIIEPSDRIVLKEGAHLVIEDIESSNISELEKMFPVDIDRDLEPLFKQNHQSIDRH